MSKLISKLIKKTFFCIFILLTLGLFNTCKDPNSPFHNPLTNNLGPKVVVEEPTIYVYEPQNNSYVTQDANGNITFYGYAKAYIKVEKVEWKVFANKLYKQKETDWSTAGISPGAGAGVKEWPAWTLTINPNRLPDGTRLNEGRDSYTTMQFRITDSSTPKTSVKYIFKIKNKPTEVSMTFPHYKTILADEAADPPKPSKIPYGGEIQGDLIDIKGLRPGYPQIKLWPDKFAPGEGSYTDGEEPPDDDPRWGWASLFLPGVGKGDVYGIDDIQKETSQNVAGPGTYANRTKMRVVNTAAFSLRLAEYTIIRPANGNPGDPDYRPADPDYGTPNYPDDPNFPIRYIKYTVEGGKHKPFGAERVFNFRIRTSDVTPDSGKGEIPTATEIKGIEGFFPPVDFRDPEKEPDKTEDPFHPRVDSLNKIQPVKIVIKSSDAKPSVEIFNDVDLSNQPFKDNGTPLPVTQTNAFLNEPKNKPNPYISEATSKKIAIGKTGTADFRLRLLVYQEGFKNATLTWKHEATGRYGELSWESGYPKDYTDANGQQAKILSFTADGGLTETNSALLWHNQRIFTSHTEPYILIVTVVAGDDTKTEYRYPVYMDGQSPDVSIRYITGAYDEPSGSAVEFSDTGLSPLTPPVLGFMKNSSIYTVNGNIQVVIDRTDASNIMTWRDGMGAEPPGNNDDRYGYPMVKWVIEAATATELEPSGTTMTNLKNFKNNPTPAGLTFFNDISDNNTRPPSPPMSGWVRKMIPDAPRKEDKAANIKINTANLTTTTGYYWLYIIAQDQTQNLGFIAQKIYVDQGTDRPEINIPTLYKTNASDTPSGGTPIAGPGNLDVAVGPTTPTPTSGNYSANRPKRNILVDGKGIDLVISDDDGIDPDTGITITLTDLNIASATGKPVTVKLNGNSKSWTGSLSQKEMAQALYGAGATELRDGMYKIDFTVKDDVNAKVKLEPPQYYGGYTGDSPTEVYSYTNSGNPNDHVDTYYFAVYTTPPEVEITEPKAGTAGSSAEGIIIKGKVSSRLNVQNAWITFTPDVITYNTTAGSSSAPIKLPLYIDPECTISPPALVSPGVAPPATTTAPFTLDDDGFYTYYWKYAGPSGTGVIFHPLKPNPSDGAYFTSDMRLFTVEAYDRLGNMGKEDRTVQIDGTPPDVFLIDFNRDRPSDPDDGKLYVYGKVSFVVSASDMNGLHEVMGKDPLGKDEMMSGIKWWVLPASDPEPTWTTDFPTPGTGGMGGNFLLRQMSNGRYTGIIDTRKITTTKSSTEYKFYIIAMDKAGNPSSNKDATTAPYTLYRTFLVDQDKDYPVINPESLFPPLDSVSKSGPTISGAVSDADLFNSVDQGKLNRYVEIRFPSNIAQPNDPPTWPAADVGWIRINVPTPYSATLGGIDASNAIVFKFRPADYPNDALKKYLKYNNVGDDGIKYYQIRVTDEPVAPTDAEKNSGAKNYGKNPDSFMQNNPDYPGYVYNPMPAVAKIFPSETTGYKFIIDGTDPEIYFDKYDPTGPNLGHPNYTPDRPTYARWDLLKAALSGKVVEYKLNSLTLSWSGKLKGKDEYNSISAIILNNPKDPPTSPPDPYNPTAGEYLWNLDSKVITPPGVTRPPDLTTVDDKALEKFFDSMDDGMQIIVFEAIDMNSNSKRVSWIFSKDTRGPEINFNNISRSIERISTKTFIPAIPGTDNFPNFPADTGTEGTPGFIRGWPSDWRYGNEWSKWAPSWQAMTRDWPSEYAFFKVGDILKTLNEEDGRKPSTIKDTPPVIEGSFSDEYSSVRLSKDDTPPTFFYYRFKNPKDGTVLPIPTDVTQINETVSLPNSLWTWDGATLSRGSGTWIKKQIEPAAIGPDGKPQNERSADWKITLDKANGFSGTDGENWVDIRVEDSAGNIAEIFNVRFVVDRYAPILGEPDYPDPNDKTQSDSDEFIVQRIANYGPPAWVPKKLPLEMQRVFSAAGYPATDTVNADNEAFTLKGKVSDFNLSNLQITIGHDIIVAAHPSYTVVATVEIDPSKISGSNPYGISKQPVDKVNGSDDPSINSSTAATKNRLQLTGLSYNETDGTPIWDWTLTVKQKDIRGLRDAAGQELDMDYTESARRYIRVTASDKAQKRVGPENWYFYLDKEKPKIEYTNLDPGVKGSCSSFENESFALSGIVSDDTKIQNLRYMIGRWQYNPEDSDSNKMPGWRWYSGSGWTLSAPPADHKTWPSVFNDTLDGSGNVTKYDPARLTTMNWTITQTMLNAAKTGANNAFPTDLFKQEGYYRLELYATDFSLGNGNPNDTYLIVDPDFSDNGGTTGRVFLIDKKDPTLFWGWYETTPDGEYKLDDKGQKIPDTNDTTNSGRTYFANNKGQVLFSFTVGDGNTIQSWEAKVEDPTKTTVIKTQLSPNDTNLVWDNIDLVSPSLPPAKIPISSSLIPGAANEGIDKKAIGDQKLIIAPFMTGTGTMGGTALDKLDGNTDVKKYTITIKVTDGANRTSTITKQFNLDNNPPVFVQEKFKPDSAPYSFRDGLDDDASPPGRVHSLNAVSGRLNIRGNTTDNSNQIKRIAFYVPDSADFASFPNPADISDVKTAGSEKFWHWQDPVNAGKFEIATGTGDSKITLLEIDDGTTSWRINVPKTSMFQTGTAATYVQWTKTGGVPMKPESPVAAPGNYQDVSFVPGTMAAATKPRPVPALTFPDLVTTNSQIYGNEDVGLITVYMLAEDAAGNRSYDLLKYWIWPEGDRPIVTAINNPNYTLIEAERLLNGSIRLSGMAKDNERVKFVWFRVLDDKGVPYGTGINKKLTIPKWKYEDAGGTPISGNWDEAGGNQDPVNGDTIGSRRTDDPLIDLSANPVAANDNGWYMANGGNSPLVSWWAYINTNGELDPTGSEPKKFTVEVRAQDTTYDDIKGQWVTYDPYATSTSGYRGMASVPLRVDAWVVAGAPIFENVLVAPVPSNDADGPPVTWESIDKLNIRNRSAYKVTVKHNSGLSAIRWSPTYWNGTVGTGGDFQANSRLDTYNLMDLDTTTNPADPEYWYVDRSGKDGSPANNANYYVVKKGTRTTVFTTNNMNSLSSKTATTPRMAVTVKPPVTVKGNGSNVTLKADRQYLVWKWDDALEGTAPPLVKHDDTTHWDTSVTPRAHKDMKNTIIPASSSARSFNIGNAILIESGPSESVGGKDIYYFKWDVIVDVRADLLLQDMTTDDGNYGKQNLAGRADQYANSVRYPVYLSASEVSKATPLTTRGDTLLPIDNREPYGAYTLNRKPAGIAATIGGEAGDDGPVNGVARVVLWFSRTTGGTTEFISWHEKEQNIGTTKVTTLPAVTDFKVYNDTTNKGPVWWDKLDAGVIPSDVLKPYISQSEDPTDCKTNGVGAYAIVIDDNRPTTPKNIWGQALPMGFADGGAGKVWYVEINSFGITSGPVDLHYVVMDKAGNAMYYKERLVIMNGVAVINKVRLATDIRGNFGSAWTAPTRVGKGSTAVPSGTEANGRNEILNKIWDGVPLGTNYVQKGITDEISSVALGVNNIIDFNVRNKLFALRVETTAGPGSKKDRYFRLEYVSGATPLTNTTPGVTPARTELSNIKAGRVYIINDPGDARWGAVGAEGDGPWPRGYAFLAAIDGTVAGTVKITGAGSAWELNSSYYSGTSGAARVDANIPAALRLLDVKYNATTADVNADAVSAEFVYNSAAFGATAGSTIIDTSAPNDSYPAAQGTNPVTRSPGGAGISMFILRVFDGPEVDMFGDFTIIRVRINNDDRTPPFAQLYDINPKTEGQERQNIAQNSQGQNVEEARSLAPMFIGEGTDSNRTKGGLWNTAATVGAVAKPGHIEPRKITYPAGAAYAPYNTWQHSLSSADMGGAATSDDATITKPFANPNGFFVRDTVSGRVVLRGYVEDNERIARVELRIGGTNFNILESDTGAGVEDNATNRANYVSPRTGLLKASANANNRVYFTDSIDLYRHRVEWAYIWDTESPGPVVSPANTPVNVRVVSYNTNAGASADKPVASGTHHSNTSTIRDDDYRPNTSPSNPGFPVNIYEYNSIDFNLRPYITGFKRNQATFAHDTRSRQGRYMFARNETAVVTGFNLLSNTNAAAVINLPSAANIATANVGTIGDFGITTANNTRYRQFTVGDGAITGNGLVTLTVNGLPSVNTGSDRPMNSGRPYIQPWNIEYSPGKDGTDLWDDYTQVHIWQSNDRDPGGNNDTAANASGRFASRNNAAIFNPAMSLDPKTGILYESHNESGGATNDNQQDWYNSGRTRKSAITAASISPPAGNTQDTNNALTADTANLVTQFADPIFFSDVYRSPGYNSGGTNIAADTWVVSSIIGRSSDIQYWRALGGIYIHGPGGVPMPFYGGGFNTGGGSSQTSHYSKFIYHGESTWYNASTLNNDAGPWTDQFMNPHIVTSYGPVNGTTYEHIHVSYYDDKDKSIKYRYNRRGTPGAVDAGENASASNSNNIPKMWTNLDGGQDGQDTAQTTYTWGGDISMSARVTTANRGTLPGSGAIRAGKHNSIAVNSNGYPVVAYYDETNQRLKLAVSNRVDPVLGANWTIIPNYISSFGTGEFVSMKIDTVGGTNQNRVHIAAMNTNKNLVYITFVLSGQTISGAITEQVVDSVGNVGRWCSLSLDVDGNPWISYMDESYLNARDGAKVAFLNKDTFYKGVDSGSNRYCPGQYKDINGKSIEGWETMHVPTLHRVQNPVEGPGREHGRLGMECFPARNNTPNVTRFWSGAVSYLSNDAEGGGAAMNRYRLAYYVK